VVVLGLDSEYEPTIPSLAVDAVILARDDGWDAPYAYFDRYYGKRFPVRSVLLKGWTILIEVEDKDDAVPPLTLVS